MVRRYDEKSRFHQTFIPSYLQTNIYHYNNFKFISIITILNDCKSIIVLSLYVLLLFNNFKSISIIIKEPIVNTAPPNIPPNAFQVNDLNIPFSSLPDILFI